MRFSKISRRVWNDEAFRSFSEPAKLLWFRLLTGPELSNIPGLFQANDAQLARALGWTLEAFGDAMRYALTHGMAKANWEAGLVWIPNAIRHNEPQSVNVVKSWKKTFDELPECDLKNEALLELKAYTDAMPKAFRLAFRHAFADAIRKASPIQEQEQEQDLFSTSVENTGGAETESKSLPRNLKQALEIPLTERAQIVADNPDRATWMEPHKWPEVVEIANALHSAFGLKGTARLSALKSDSGVRAVVTTLAAGFEVKELLRVAESLPRSELAKRAKGPLGLSSLSVEVVRRGLASLDGPKPKPLTKEPTIGTAEADRLRSL